MKQEGAVFSINFLRHEITPMSVRRFMAYAALGYFAVNALLLIALIAGSVSAHLQRGKILASEGTKSLSGPTAETLKRDLAGLRGEVLTHLTQLDSLTTFYNERFRVAGKLAGLARTLPARTWISEFQGSRSGRSFRIEATYLVDPEKPYEEPAKGWIPALRSDVEFGQGLKRLESLKSSQKKQGNTELYSFELAAEWNPEKSLS